MRRLTKADKALLQPLEAPARAKPGPQRRGMFKHLFSRKFDPFLGQKTKAPAPAPEKTIRCTLAPGQWFSVDADDGLQGSVKIYSGADLSKKFVRKITKFQAMSLMRWHADSEMMCGVQDGNFRWHTVYVYGDIEAFLGLSGDHTENKGE